MDFLEEEAELGSSDDESVGGSSSFSEDLNDEVEVKKSKGKRKTDKKKKRKVMVSDDEDEGVYYMVAVNSPHQNPIGHCLPIGPLFFKAVNLCICDEVWNLDSANALRSSAIPVNH